MSRESWRVAPPDLPPILAAALDEFLERGYHGATVRDIASRAGLTVPSLYYHYESKEGLLRAVLMASLEPIVGNVERAAADAEAPADRLSNIVECLVFAMTVDAPSAAIDAAEARYLGPANHARYVAVRDRMEAILQEVLESGTASGEFVVDDVSEARRAILGLTQSIPRWYHREGRDTPDAIARRYARLVLRMVGVAVA